MLVWGVDRFTWRKNNKYLVWQENAWFQWFQVDENLNALQKKHRCCSEKQWNPAFFWISWNLTLFFLKQKGHSITNFLEFWERDQSWLLQWNGVYSESQEIRCHCITNPNNALLCAQITQNFHRFVSCDSPNMGKFMTSHIASRNLPQTRNVSTTLQETCWSVWEKWY